MYSPGIRVKNANSDWASKLIIGSSFRIQKIRNIGLFAAPWSYQGQCRDNKESHTVILQGARGKILYKLKIILGTLIVDMTFRSGTPRDMIKILMKLDRVRDAKKYILANYDKVDPLYLI